MNFILYFFPLFSSPIYTFFVVGWLADLRPTERGATKIKTSWLFVHVKYHRDVHEILAVRRLLLLSWQSWRDQDQCLYGLVADDGNKKDERKQKKSRQQLCEYNNFIRSVNAVPTIITLKWWLSFSNIYQTEFLAVIAFITLDNLSSFVNVLIDRCIWIQLKL